jgi:hypothetical protein
MLKIHEVVAVFVAAGVFLIGLVAIWLVRSAGGSPPSLGTATSAPRVSSSASSPAPSSEPTRLGPFRKDVANSRTILVVGDSSGDEFGEWVDLWAQDLASNRKVTYHQWASGAGFTASPAVYGTSKLHGSEKPMEIWNLSYQGVAADYAKNLSDVPVRPDTVILNIGHDRDRGLLDRTIRTTTDGVNVRWGDVPSALVLQNPSTGAEAKGQEEAVFEVRSLAMKYRMPVIDAHAAFLKAGDVKDLLVDGRRPNERGSRVWADAVAAALTP